ncbi:twinkle homolog protein, chloroplastic/mitochondrial-like isoform X3 [Quercus robur]|uniref:twinkle homolog protein, chloroplastic/mitochondrial-like isoform X3 n=1 Tax=Quercus robur TaxID=38942 RepID=UPI002163686F|nr:twinkle homolog protein, chloroplastic/mitochondrial-like isoform X3 [Quercus robur]
MAIRCCKLFGSMQGNFWRNTMKPFFDARCEDDSLSSINWVLNLARAAVLRHGVRGLVIDPYNELYHQCLVSQNHGYAKKSSMSVRTCIHGVFSKKKKLLFF